MACCATRKTTAPRKGELVARVGLRTMLVVTEHTLTLGAPLSGRLRLWRDFTTMLRDAEEQEVACVLQDLEPVGMSRLGRVLSGRLVAHSPTAAGYVYRRLGRARPGPLLDSAAALLAGALEDHALP